jgi:transcriptional regulator with XRE-family HTH domain
MRHTHTYSPQTLDAAKVLGLDIAAARRELRWTAVDLAERAGISTITLRRVERGDPTVALGTAFELATLLGVRLFVVDQSELPRLIERGKGRLALLPSRVRERDIEVFDDF